MVFFLLSQEYMIPKLPVTQNGKLSYGLKKKLLSQHRAGAPTPSRKTRAASVKEDSVLASPNLHTPSCWAPAPFRPAFRGSRAHLSSSVNGAGSLPEQPHTPCHEGLDCLGNNGGNMKQGLTTGSDSLNSQPASLKGPEWQEGPGQLGGRVPVCSLLTPQ